MHRLYLYVLMWKCEVSRCIMRQKTLTDKQTHKHSQNTIGRGNLITSVVLFWSKQLFTTNHIIYIILFCTSWKHLFRLLILLVWPNPMSVAIVYLGSRDNNETGPSRVVWVLLRGNCSSICFCRCLCLTLKDWCYCSIETSALSLWQNFVLQLFRLNVEVWNRLLFAERALVPCPVTFYYFLRAILPKNCFT